LLGERLQNIEKWKISHLLLREKDAISLQEQRKANYLKTNLSHVTPLINCP